MKLYVIVKRGNLVATLANRDAALEYAERHVENDGGCVHIYEEIAEVHAVAVSKAAE